MAAVIEQSAKQMPEMLNVRLKMTSLHLHASGVFSNVYKGTLTAPAPQREIAIKKTWPENKERNFEMIFLTGISREKHKNIVQMLFAFSNKTKDGRVCESFVFDFMPDTLASTIKTNTLDMVDIKLYTWQLFSGLRYLAAQHIVHRDIKPVNILLDHKEGTLKIGDFGSAKIIKEGTTSTPYQVTRFYRPPELLFGSPTYNTYVDLWSGGCVLGEMLRGNVLFPGRDQRLQLKLLFTTLGSPSESDMRAMKVPARLDNSDGVVGAGLTQLLPDASPDAVFFLSKILVYKPKNRLGGKELLKDPFFTDLLKEGTKRANGQMVNKVITPTDVSEANSDELEKRQRRNLSALMARKPQFSLSVEEKPSKMPTSNNRKEDKRMQPSSNTDSSARNTPRFVPSRQSKTESAEARKTQASSMKKPVSVMEKK